MNLKIQGAILSITILLSGCGGSDDNGLPTTELEGTWIEGCYSYDDGTSDTTTVVFSNNTFTSNIMEYSDPSCGTLSAEFKSSGTFATGNLIATDSGLSAKEIDLITLLENDLEVIENFFDIFRIDQGLLYTGDKTGTRDGSTGAKRPASLDSTRYLTKI